MPIVAYREGYRNVWMFPRNIRKIPPWKMSNILHIFLMQNKIGWMSDQNVQNEFYKYLEESGLKTEGFLYHPKSGGARTYYSQLMALGLIFRREKDGIRYNFPTIAGEALVKGEKPLGVMQYLLLKHQYPSAYGRRRNVRINPDLRVKPFMFVLQLLNLDGVDKLRNEELAVAVVYGHNHECLSICAEKILELRSGKNFLDILEIPERDTYTPRGSDDLKKRISNSVMDVANTCKNYMESCLLVNVEKEGSKDVIKFNEDIRGKYNEELNYIDHFIEAEAEERFQRIYGCWNREKDTRRLKIEEADTAALSRKVMENKIASEFFKLCGEKKINKIPEEFIYHMEENWGFEREIVREVVEPYLEKALDIFESTFLDLSRGGRGSATEFEKVLTDFFREEFYFEAEHTGSRKSPPGRIGGYADIFLVALDERHCALVDAKATSDYHLPADDYRSMVKSYIPNYTELTGERQLKLEFCLYAAHGYSRTINSRLAHMSEESSTPISAVRAKTILELGSRIKEPEQQENLRAGFRKGRCVSIVDF